MTEVITMERTITAQAARIAELERELADSNAVTQRKAETITRVVSSTTEQLVTASETIARLEAQIAAMPLNALRRFYLFSRYDENAADDATYAYAMPQYISDDNAIGAWLATMDGDA